MAFGGHYDLDPLDGFVLVLEDRHRSHFVDITQVWILLVYNFFFFEIFYN